MKVSGFYYWISRICLFPLLFAMGKPAVQAQVVGGTYSMEFLRTAQNAHIQALGGMNVAYQGNDVAMAFQNPALMNKSWHNQLSLTYHNLYSDIRQLNLLYGYYLPQKDVNLLFGIQYMHYGKMDYRDQYGNIYGTFRPIDFSVQAGFSKAYRERWQYGALVKFANSRYHEYKASALLADIGVRYLDTAHLFMVGVVAKNIGFMLDKYASQGQAEPLPFDLQLGASKGFQHLPLRLMATVHHLYTWDIRYNNPDDQKQLFMNDEPKKEGSYFGDKLLRHFVFAAELTIAKRLSLQLGYNFLRRAELKTTMNPGLTGFSFGAGLDLNRFRLYYGRTMYHVSGAQNHFGIQLALQKFIPGGPKLQQLGWNADYTIRP